MIRLGVVGLIVAVAASVASAANPGRNGRIVFVSTVQGRGGFGSQAIVSLRPDGTNPRRLGGGDAETTLDFDPAWSPDGRRIAFVRSLARIGNAIGPGTAGSEIYVMNAEGKQKRRLTRNALADGSPTWSPDRKRLLFWRGQPYGRRPFADLWVMNADGTRQRRLAKTSAVERDPAWAPRGGRIAFVAGRGLWVSAANGRNRRLVAEGDGIGDPSWSPDGARIAFTTKSGIVIANADGQDARLLARGLEDAEWAPDGSALVASRAGTPFDVFRGVYVVSLDGDATPLTRDPAPGAELIVEHFQPDWQPRP